MARGWQHVVPLASYRHGHSATRLDDGRVLVAGGTKRISVERERACDFDDPCSLTAVEIIDPETMTTTAVAPLPGPREAHETAAIPGGVILVGGIVSGGGCMNIQNKTWIWRAADGEWRDGSPITGVYGATVTSLGGGRVLVAGGIAPEVTAMAWIWAPTRGTWAPAASLNRPRYLHRAVALSDGRVLVAGGLTGSAEGHLLASASVELYDPRTDTWTENGPLGLARCEHSLTLLADGSVLALGGYGEEKETVFDSAELRDPATAEWSDLGPLAHARVNHTATRLDDGRVLVIGGMDRWFLPGGETPRIACAAAEMFDPATVKFDEVDGPSMPRWGHTATLLDDGRVLVVGGKSGPGMLDTAEVWSA